MYSIYTYHTVCMIASSTTRYLVRKYLRRYESTKIDTVPSFVVYESTFVRKYFRTKVRKYYSIFEKVYTYVYTYTYSCTHKQLTVLPEVFYLRLRSLYARRYSTKVLSYYFRKYNERCTRTFKYESKKRYFRSYFRK